MHDSKRMEVEQEPEIIRNCRWFTGDVEMECQAKIRLAILGTDLQGCQYDLDFGPITYLTALVQLPSWFPPDLIAGSLPKMPEDPLGPPGNN